MREKSKQVQTTRMKYPSESGNKNQLANSNVGFTYYSRSTVDLSALIL